MSSANSQPISLCCYVSFLLEFTSIGIYVRSVYQAMTFRFCFPSPIESYWLVQYLTYNQWRPRPSQYSGLLRRCHISHELVILFSNIYLLTNYRAWLSERALIMGNLACKKMKQGYLMKVSEQVTEHHVGDVWFSNDLRATRRLLAFLLSHI